MDQLELQPLPYPKHALEPHIGRETVALHYDKHHAGYLKKLKELVAGKPEAEQSLEALARTAEGPIFENAAQVWNHDFYWRSMRPGGGGEPDGGLAEVLATAFGSFAEFRARFLEIGTGHFGSGWLWLVRHDERLNLCATPDADQPFRDGDTPLLCADLWEHAYYLDYHNERERYLTTFLDELVNWSFAQENWDRAIADGPFLRRVAR